MDVSRFLAKAEQALRKRQPEQAAALYRQVLVAAPGHGPARAGLLAAFRRRAELKGGASLLDRAAAKSLRAAAAGLAGANKPAALVKACEAALEKDPSDAWLAARLADGLEALGRPAEALAVWEHRLALDERDVEALKAAGKLHHALRQVEEAADCLDRAHALAPRDPEVDKLRKRLAAEQTLARTGFDTAGSSRELVRDADALREAGRARRLHRTEAERAEDVEALRAALTADPGDVDGWRSLVRTLLRAGDIEAAEAAAADGLSHHASDEALRDLAGDARLARLAAALRVAEGPAAGAPGDAPRAAPGHEPADSPGETPGDADAARAALRAARVEELGRRHRRDPGDAALRLRLARACKAAGRVDEALEHFQALVGDPRHEVEARRGLGACFAAKGLLPLARRQLETALERVGGVAGGAGSAAGPGAGPGGGDLAKEICYSLGLVCERQGDSQGALARFLEVYEVDIHFRDVASRIASPDAPHDSSH